MSLGAIFLYVVQYSINFFLNRRCLQEGEDENDFDSTEPVENNTLINDEESERTMLLGRGGIQQYKGKTFNAIVQIILFCFSFICLF